MTTRKSRRWIVASAVALCSIGAIAVLNGQQEVTIGATDIGGVVTGPNGPEAGVWVIAETADLPTKFAKIVVTDDRGRYVIPDLPKANYNVWVRGYGLVDSPKVKTTRGQHLNLTAVPAPNAGRGGRILSGRVLVFDAADSRTRANFPAPARTATAFRAVMKTQARLDRYGQELAASPAMRSARKGVRTIPKELGTFRQFRRQAWDARACRPARRRPTWR